MTSWYNKHSVQDRSAMIEHLLDMYREGTLKECDHQELTLELSTLTEQQFEQALKHAIDNSMKGFGNAKQILSLA